MSRNCGWISSAVFFGGLILAGLSSGCGGTEAGNPNVSTASANSSPGSSGSSNATDTSVTEASLVQNALCAKLSSCFPSLSAMQCQLGIGNTPGFGSALGVSAGGPSTLSSVSSAEQSGTLTASSANATRCESDIAALGCSTVSQDYSTSAPNDFSEVPNLIPTSGTSCAGVY